ncbi:putative phosphatidylserine synthase [Polaribacter irgensii 23-P]|uniref:Putative phosphatidylserine synthase n=1 Tax=Polaribacter irgensii 23-P TaxID=313594 RepID=A4C1I2_9FLAO|nr:CDP-alcohol phosphatidyltransferase family protein [Polaribacter irgensii]EAR11985.1 putative phosphatidylserine synthase [Polaribacter irgensii 23-P]
MKKHIPNLLTLGNLFCGTVAAMYAVQGNFEIAGILVIIGIVFDFFDGFAARLLGVSGELGKQLDSLADMVTSGVVPGVIMFYLLSQNELGVEILVQPLAMANFIPFLGLLLTLGAGYRLAKFNIDTRQTNSFIGLPTPAMSLFVISLPLIIEYSEIEFVNNIINNVYFLIGVTVALTYFMNAQLPLFSLKFKGYALKTNSVQYVFILISLFLILSLNVISIPIIIILYVLTSIIQNYYKPK